MNKAEHMRKIAEQERDHQVNVNLQPILKHIEKYASNGFHSCSYSMTEEEAEALREEGFKVEQTDKEHFDNRYLIVWKE